MIKGIYKTLILKKKNENNTGYRAGGMKQTGNRGRRQGEKAPLSSPQAPSTHNYKASS